MRLGSSVAVAACRSAAAALSRPLAWEFPHAVSAALKRKKKKKKKKGEQGLSKTDWNGIQALHF